MWVNPLRQYSRNEGKKCENRMIISHVHVYVHDHGQLLKQDRTNIPTCPHALHMKIQCSCESIYDGTKVPIYMYR